MFWLYFVLVTFLYISPSSLQAIYLVRMCDLIVTAHGEKNDDRVGCGRGVRQTVEEACYILAVAEDSRDQSQQLA